jgi:ABC-type glutathione transport system ATPase component
MTEPVWELRGLVKRWPMGFRRPPRVAVEGVDLSIGPGERVALIGESGSGKTTLARCGLGLVPFDAGSVRLVGRELRPGQVSDDRGLRHAVQLLFQDPRAMLNPGIAIGALLWESARLHRPDADAATLVRTMLEDVGLSGRNDALPRELSGGERRRAGLARVLMAQPRLLVADEPTAGLDAAMKASLLELMLDRAGPRCAVVVISHDIPLVTWACSRILVMKDGRIVDHFATADLTSGVHTPHPYTERLLAAAGMR